MQPSHRFDVVLQPSLPEAPIVLRSAIDPNQATLAFHEELQRLTTQGAIGELILLRYNDVPTRLLRHPLEGS
jgi:hypothetical protein